MCTVPDFIRAKQAGRPLALLTCYDAPTACILAKAGVDAALVGDSVAMAVHGRHDTTQATLGMMKNHTKAARAGSSELFLIADLPFMSTQRGLARGVDAATTLIQAGANAVKLEGLAGHERLIKALVAGGIPVMGHLGLQPQSVNALGGYKKQATDADSAETLIQEAKTLEALGCFALVVECVPPSLALPLCSSLSIPAIAIGSGPGWDGQILVSHDLFGLWPERAPRFAPAYANGAELFASATRAWMADVLEQNGPSLARKAGHGVAQGAAL